MASREEAWAKAYWQASGRENEFEDRPAFIRERLRVMEETRQSSQRSRKSDTAMN